MFLLNWWWTMVRLIKSILRSFSEEWHAEERLHMKRIAWRYSDRMLMDGAMIQRTGEVIPKESA